MLVGVYISTLNTCPVKNAMNFNDDIIEQHWTFGINKHSCNFSILMYDKR